MNDPIFVPESEADAYQCIFANKATLFIFALNFQFSVQLFEFLERGGGPPSVGVFGFPFTLYRMIAARDGALNIYHFKCSLDALKKQLPTSPTIAKYVDAIKVREALKQFNKYFPNTDNIRHAISHAGEMQPTPRRQKQNIQKKDESFHGGASGAGGLFMGAIYEKTYTVGIEGTVFSVSLDNESIRKLNHTISMIDEAFQGASAPTVPQPKN